MIDSFPKKTSHQLTPHPTGSRREFWALSWPLMVGLLSSTCMLFTDRLFLSWWNPLALNAAVMGGMVYYLFLVIPMAVMEITEVLAGRLNGENRQGHIGQAIWQMVLSSLCLLPVFVLIGFFTPFLFFNGSGNEVFETIYFRTLIFTGVFQCLSIALSGFFIGIGNVKIVTFSALLGNFLNIILDYIFIFGIGKLPSLGIFGAALATAVSLIAQALFLLAVYWKKSNRKTYGTGKLTLNRAFLLEGLRVGLPSGAGRSIEMIAHFFFFRIIMTVGPEQMTLVSIVQTLYILASFIIDAESKAAGSIASNLLGANQHASLHKVLRSGFTQHLLFFLVFVALLFCFPNQLFSLFNAGENAGLLATPELLGIFNRSLLYLALFFLLDGFSWILVGFLTAAKDTRFVFLVSLAVNWAAYLPLTAVFVGWYKGGADIAWLVVVLSTTLTVFCYLWRYLSGKWLKYDQYNVEIV